MTTIFINRTIALPALLTITLFACKKFVQIPPPVDELVTASVFSDNASATAAQTVIYTNMREDIESFYMAQHNGLLSDELNNYSTNADLVAYYTNNMLAINSSTFPWNKPYNYIYQTNAILDGLGKYNGASAAIKQQLTGESKFVRAFWYFYLTNCFGDIPLLTNTNYNSNAVLARSTKTQVYDQIKTDLIDAEALLNSNYVDASDTAITIERVRPTKWAAAALLARVYLYTGEYSNAETQASLVIDSAGLYNLCSLDSVFLSNSSEAIWQLLPQIPNANGATYDGQYFILVSEPGGGSTNSNTLSSQLLSSFEPGDNRKTNWIAAYTPDSVNYFYYPYKYKDYLSTTITEYTMVLRLGEQYLIRAEVRAQQSNINGALTDLNAIRKRAGLSAYSGGTDKTSLLSEILHERQVELFTEWGHRWFDLIRTGNANAVMNVITPMKGGTWNPDDQLYPIPQGEISADPNLTQNLGY